MALGALRHLTMDRVTGRAVKCRMFALVVPELNYLLGVTGDAGVCNLA